MLVPRQLTQRVDRHALIDQPDRDRLPEPVLSMDDRIGPVRLRFFADKIFKENMETGQATVDGRCAQPCGDLFIDEGVDVLRCYGFGRFVVGGVDEDIQVANVVLQSTGLAKTTFDISLEAGTSDRPMLASTE